MTVYNKTAVYIIAILLLCVPATSCIARVTHTTFVPQNISIAFSTKYPGAYITDFKLVGDNYKASFTLNGKKYAAYFSAGGNWQKTERKLRPRQLPAAIKKDLYNSEYAAWYIDDVKEVSTPSSHMYLVHVNDANVLTITDAYLFKDDYQLTFTESGGLTNKEKLP